MVDINLHYISCVEQALKAGAGEVTEELDIFEEHQSGFVFRNNQKSHN
jgi:hypothetical protein